jgi:hypothetical protein
MKNQTAVEWLQEAISNKLSSEIGPSFLDLFEQAKAMERKQKELYIRFGYMAGFNRGLDNNPNHLEDYIEYINSLGS